MASQYSHCASSCSCLEAGSELVWGDYITARKAEEAGSAQVTQLIECFREQDRRYSACTDVERHQLVGRFCVHDGRSDGSVVRAPTIQRGRPSNKCGLISRVGVRPMRSRLFVIAVGIQCFFHFSSVVQIIHVILFYLESRFQAYR